MSSLFSSFAQSPLSRIISMPSPDGIFQPANPLNFFGGPRTIAGGAMRPVGGATPQQQPRPQQADPTAQPYGSKTL